MKRPEHLIKITLTLSKKQGNFSENLETDGFFLFEIGYDQGEDLAQIAQERGFSCEIYKDLGGCERAVILKKLQR